MPAIKVKTKIGKFEKAKRNGTLRGVASARMPPRYSASEIIGQHVEILGSCKDRHNKVYTIRFVREGRVVKNLETVRIAKDGRKIPALLTVAPINDEVGAVVGMSASVVDISRYKNVEPKLKEADCQEAECPAVPLTVFGADSRSVGMSG